MGNFVVLLFLLCFFITVVGLIGLIKPSIIHLKSRWQSAILATILYPFLGVVFVIAPDFGDASEPAAKTETISAGITFIVSWLGIVGIFAFFRRKHIPDPISTDVANPQSDEKISLWQSYSDWSKRTSEKIKHDNEIMREKAQRDKLKRQADKAAERAKVAEENIQRENAKAAERARIAALPPPSPPPVVAKPIAAPPMAVATGLPRPRKRSGSSATFIYVDANGVVTEREIRNWKIVGTYINGYCLLRKGNRDFLLSRVDEWIDYD
jgi:hypothetical protein